MTLVKRNTAASMPVFFDNFLLKDMMEWPGSLQAKLPAVNIKESNKGFEVALAVPGMEKDAFTIEVDKNILTIAAEKKESKQEEKTEKFHLREFNFSSFKRSFELPENRIAVEKIEASYEAGILKIMLPVKEEAQLKPKQIKVA